ncbi:MAG: hypothetical protein HY434_02325 [Candidatus Liptonbacteria bacterium]|nr:hypothetical protein [Candidatus Liptonbacteria bacterium]
MNVGYYPGFKSELKNFPLATRTKFYKQVEYLSRSIRHPSLRAKKYDESRGIWQARVDREIRFYFLIEGNTYVLLSIRKHPK